MSEVLDIISQVAIALTGVTAILLVARKNKWGFVVGLASQPFWFYTSYYHEQWGVFFLSFAYMATWILGIHEWFIKKDKQTNTEPETK